MFLYPRFHTIGSNIPQGEYAAGLIYPLMIFSVKLILLLILVRVFHLHRQLVFCVYALTGILSCYYLSMIIIKIRPCDPISAYWTGDITKCVNQGAVVTVDATISMVSDLAILLIPIPVVSSLQMEMKKKLRVVGMLGTAGIAIALSVYRLVLVTRDGNSPDQTIVFTKIVLSSSVVPCILTPFLLLTVWIGWFEQQRRSHDWSHVCLHSFDWPTHS